MNGLILLNKEANMTSHDLVNLVRRQLGIRRVGHTGTLDPNATGLMLIAYGRSTKLVNFLQQDDKEYILEMKLGILTETLDIWGKIIKEETFTKPSKEELKIVLDSFMGNYEQKTPMYSAVKVKGKKLYELARKNITVDTPKRIVEIYDIELLEYQNIIKIRVNCSSGTYIRVLCLDIAKKLGTVATMTSLVRSKLGNFNLSEANTLDQLKNNQYKIIKPEVALSHLPTINYDNLSDIINGRKIILKTKHDFVLIKVNNQIMAFYERENKNTFKSKRGLW